MPAALPVRVAAVNDYELIVAGVATLLSQFPDRIDVAERLVIGEPIDGRIDVALYDTYGRAGLAGPALKSLISSPDIGAVAVFSMELTSDLIADARAAGAGGFISKALPGDLIADAIVGVHAGEPVLVTSPMIEQAPDELDWPGRSDGLSERESQALVLAAEGLTNREIASALYVGDETVKTHLHSAFSKLGLRNRTEAARYVGRTGAFARYQPAEHLLAAARRDDLPPPPLSEV